MTPLKAGSDVGRCATRGPWSLPPSSTFSTRSIAACARRARRDARPQAWRLPECRSNVQPGFRASQRVREIARHDSRRRPSPRRHEIRPEKQQAAMLIGVRVDAEAIGCALLVREEVGRHGTDDARESRYVDHAAAIGVAKVLRRLIQRLVVRRPAMHGQDKHPLEPSLAEIVARSIKPLAVSSCEWIAPGNHTSRQRSWPGTRRVETPGSEGPPIPIGSNRVGDPGGDELARSRRYKTGETVRASSMPAVNSTQSSRDRNDRSVRCSRDVEFCAERVALHRASATYTSGFVA